MKKNKNFYTVSKDYYKILGLTSEASINEIKKAFEEKSRAASDALKSYLEAKKLLEEQEKTLNELEEEASKEQILKEIEEAKKLVKEMEDEKNLLKVDQEVVEAYIVLTTYKEEYDKARAKYLKKENKRADEKIRKRARKVYVLRKKLKKAEEKATRKEINTTENLDAILGVNSTASTQDIFVANKEALSNGVDVDKVSEAYKVLSNKEKNKIYHTVVEYRNQYNGYKDSLEDAKLVEKIEEGYRPHLLSNKARIVLTTASTALLATAIIAGTLGIAKSFDKKDKNSLKNKKTIESSIDSTETESVITIDSTDSKENIVEGNTISKEITSLLSGAAGLLESQNTITPSVNDNVVTRKAELLLACLNSAGFFNVETGFPYEVEELKNIILYMNGLYVPEDEKDIYDMYTSYINLVALPLNSEDFIYQVNYAGGETSFKAKIEEAAKNPMYINFVEAVNLDNSYGIEYAKWLQDQYFTLLYTTDKETYNKVYSEVWQSFAEIMKGNGTSFTLDGVTYTITEEELLQKGNVGVQSLITLWLFNMEPFKNLSTQETFTVNQQYLSADINSQNDYATIQEMYDYINTACEMNDSDTLYEGQTWGERVQSNMKASGYEQLASRGYSLSNTR